MVSYPDLSGDSWRLIGTSEEVCEVLAGVEFTELYPDEVPLLADKDGEFWAAVASSSPEVLWETSRTYSLNSPPVDPQVSQSEIEGCQLFTTSLVK